MVEKRTEGLVSTIADVEQKIADIEQQLAALKRQRAALVECDTMIQQLASSKYNPSLNAQKVAVVIGGAGVMGQMFVRLFRHAQMEVHVLEKGEWRIKKDIFQNPDLVLVAVPIHAVEPVLRELPELPSNCILVDVTSVKADPVAWMMDVHKGPVLGLHPMFGPGTSGFNKQTVVACKGREEEQSDWLLKLLEKAGADIVECDAEDHDRAMAKVQALRHFTSFVYGLYLKEMKVDLEQLLQLSSPIYRLELIMVGRLFAQNAELYADIIFRSDFNASIVKGYAKCLQEALHYFDEKDPTKFLGDFNSVREWMGELSQKFLAASDQLLSREGLDLETKKFSEKITDEAVAC